MVAISSRKLRVLVIAILRIHHLYEEDWITFSGNSFQSNIKGCSHVGNDVLVVLVVGII
jgi:hypothetical protein